MFINVVTNNREKPYTDLRESTHKFGKFGHKKFFAVNPRFHSLLRCSPQKFGEFKQTRGLLRRRLENMSNVKKVYGQIPRIFG
jgi:hypothetical protein